jgi:hypothetical protein
LSMKIFRWQTLSKYRFARQREEHFEAPAFNAAKCYSDQSSRRAGIDMAVKRRMSLLRIQIREKCVLVHGRKGG